MKIAVVDDRSKLLRTLCYFFKLSKLDLTTFSGHVNTIAGRTKRTGQFDALLLIRERAQITRQLLQGLPMLNFISFFGRYPRIDVRACSDHGVLLLAVNSGRFGKAIINIFDKEPITWQGDEFACHPGVVATPNSGFVTNYEFEMQFSEVIEQARSLASGRPINMLNPDMWQVARRV